MVLVRGRRARDLNASMATVNPSVRVRHRHMYRNRMSYVAAAADTDAAAAATATTTDAAADCVYGRMSDVRDSHLQCIIII